MNTVIGVFAVVTLGLLWLGFGLALLFNPALLDRVWGAFRRLPIVVQLLIGLLILPAIPGLWIWRTPWPLWLQLTLILVLGLAALYAFLPRHTSDWDE